MTKEQYDNQFDKEKRISFDFAKTFPRAIPPSGQVLEHLLEAVDDFVTVPVLKVLEDERLDGLPDVLLRHDGGQGSQLNNLKAKKNSYLNWQPITRCCNMCL